MISKELVNLLASASICGASSMVGAMTNTMRGLGFGVGIRIRGSGRHLGYVMGHREDKSRGLSRASLGDADEIAAAIQPDRDGHHLDGRGGCRSRPCKPLLEAPGRVRTQAIRGRGGGCSIL